ncbi:Septum site-determining protein MinD [Marine Group I thaumarchaeote SCGC AAA799-E16]|uniref:Septum site-determining protein MinD n=4 Tax=Marine Group I TaxID=905826 RepID=A0A081RQ92_9ARCH|nr:Septum site-determining protein MinD [Marine Group I thaumarchaeote SCGC AAA799-N04]KER06439.1 Septum site-determining protein MinD [Marine Group I thaumarchaeote SCGC AAA799-E16]KFM14443.1 Septum site-determining protein MinD [Marine Group I thaumarchaeote SCGC AAA799-D11]
MIFSTKLVFHKLENQASLKYEQIMNQTGLKTIFVSGTAGSGKSLLSSKLYDYYTKNGAFTSILNLDPGVENLPYSCDIDVRDFVDIVSIMQQYDLGPNGALVMAADLIASKIDEIQNEVNRVNPDYLIVDTPGQIELFAYRSSGRFLIDNITSEEKTNIFLFDGALITTPVNFVSIALLATSIRLRLNLPTVNVLTKTDLIGANLKNILQWSTSLSTLENAIAKDADGDTYTLTTNILRGLNLSGFAQGLIPISNVTGDGFVNLEGALSRILNLGEEVED